MPPEDEPYLRLLTVRLDALSREISDVKSELRNDTLTRKEWTLATTNLEQRLSSLQGDIYHLRNLINSSKAPWWTYVTVFVAIGGLLWSMLAPTI